MVPLRRDRGVVIAASWLGKLKTLLQVIAIFALILLDPIPVWADVLLYVAVAVTVISGADYFFGVHRKLGEESVSVPAGTFSAHKVEVWSTRNATGGPAQAQLEPVGIHYLVWYAAEAKRYVKMQRRVISASNSENEHDVFELVAPRMP